MLVKNGRMDGHHLCDRSMGGTKVRAANVWKVGGFKISRGDRRDAILRGREKRRRPVSVVVLATKRGNTSVTVY